MGLTGTWGNGARGFRIEDKSGSLLDYKDQPQELVT